MGNDDEPGSKERQVTQTSELILKQAVLDTRRFDEERQVAENLRNGEGIKNKLKERARVVAGLPERVSQAELLTGQKLPEDEMAYLRSLQYIAQKALERGNVYELGLILTDTLGGLKKGEPNLLEQLVNRLYPQNP
ncbi:MAG: hypothetical protein AAB907_00870 [Patescibacteria group bacterium]